MLPWIMQVFRQEGDGQDCKSSQCFIAVRHLPGWIWRQLCTPLAGETSKYVQFMVSDFHWRICLLDWIAGLAQSFWLFLMLYLCQPETVFLRNLSYESGWSLLWAQRSTQKTQFSDSCLASLCRNLAWKEVLIWYRSLVIWLLTKEHGPIDGPDVTYSQRQLPEMAQGISKTASLSVSTGKACQFVQFLYKLSAACDWYF